MKITLIAQHTAIIGLAATALMDIWLIGLKRAGIPTMNFGLLGRWVGHLFKGRALHTQISKSPAVAGELILGWLTHYLTGLLFAATLIMFAGEGWLISPTPLAAMATGITTVLCPWLLMQPAMGLGFAASKTPAPLGNALRNLINHTVFGFGLYIGGLLSNRLMG
ncbi:MAG: DUF2938 domain-containing protein [Limnobacter sp.]|uniref:DUF2938 domain-containing protein n=1 Tax=Limnobacter sp. TaxID=2003368 RepID=UPI00391BCBB4